MEKLISHLLISELSDAKSKGFAHDFIAHANGLLHTLTNPDRYYDIHEFAITVFPCLLLNATLYLISTYDGVKGTMIDYHEF